jgi:negative regulator of flagellin synthesis FlgM
MAATNGIGSQPIQQSYIPELKPQAADADKSTSSSSIAVTGSQSDTTSISSTSGLIAQALGGSDVRSDKVAALQQSIASGTYSVSASDVASKIVDSLLS